MTAAAPAPDPALEPSSSQETGPDADLQAIEYFKKAYATLKVEVGKGSGLHFVPAACAKRNQSVYTQYTSNLSIPPPTARPSPHSPSPGRPQ